jgi:hypothetical protein
MRPVCGAVSGAGLLPAAAVLLLACPAPALDYRFPPDPPGSVCIDRAFERIGGSQGADFLYAVMYSHDGTASVHIYTGVTVEDGIEWRLRHEWIPSFDGYPVPIPVNAILDMYLNDDGSAVLSYVDDLETYEGSVCIYLWIDPGSGGFTESWSD